MEDKISEVEKKVEESGSIEVQKRYWDKEVMLRRKEEQLRKNEEQLRKKEEQLREELLLRKKELQKECKLSHVAVVIYCRHTISIKKHNKGKIYCRGICRGGEGFLIGVHVNF